MLAELLANLSAGCCNSPRLTDWQAVACANEAQQASKEIAKLHVILAKERNDCWLMPVTAASRPFDCNVTTSLPATSRNGFKGSPDSSKLFLVFLDQQSTVAVSLVDVLPC